MLIIITLLPQPVLLQREFALKHLPDYAPFKLVSNLYEVVPQVLLKTGKVRVDALTRLVMRIII